MSFAVTALAPQLNAAVLANPIQDAHTGASLRQAVDEYCGNVPHIPLPKGGGGDDGGWCGTVPRHFPPLPPTGGDDGGWCGTVPHRLPFPPPPPQPWVDLANQALAFR